MLMTTELLTPTPGPLWRLAKQAGIDHVVFHDEEPTDMLECMRAYHETGFDGPMRPDHVPALAGESNESYGYAILGRLFAVGYITGLRDATYGRPPARYGRQVGEDVLR